MVLRGEAAQWADPKRHLLCKTQETHKSSEECLHFAYDRMQRAGEKSRRLEGATVRTEWAFWTHELVPIEIKITI